MERRTWSMLICYTGEITLRCRSKLCCKNVDPCYVPSALRPLAHSVPCTRHVINKNVPNPYWKMLCDQTVVRDEDTGDVLHVGVHDGTFGEAAILPVSAPTQLEPSHDCCASLSCLKVGRPHQWYLRQKKPAPQSIHMLGFSSQLHSLTTWLDLEQHVWCSAVSLSPDLGGFDFFELIDINILLCT
jgi:hypothetical protein